MQATVHRFDHDGSGSVLLDDGVELPFGVDAWRAATSPVRLLRPGQRVVIDLDVNGEGIATLTLVTLPL